MNAIENQPAHSNSEPETEGASSGFAADIIAGLSKSPKTVSSKYFYDAAGSKLFQQIMALPEYYITRTEFEILENQKSDIIEFFGTSEFFHLVELGTGDGSKTKILLRELLYKNAPFEYAPVDISEDALLQLKSSLKADLPKLDYDGFTGDYFEALDWMKRHKPGRKVVLFLGSNIGNFGEDNGEAFLKKIASYLNPGDKILMGFDLQKDPKIIRQAYDDAEGVTAAFNMNLLHRINTELNTDFDLENFEHFTDYDPLEGVIKSYLVSKTKQTVHFPEQNTAIYFEAWEAIHTENSRKYTLQNIEALAQKSGLKIAQVFSDERYYFADVLFLK